ncbi:MAG TPA: hypothetical protein VMT62_04795 [Syntrophorhabdaceae bacterium]|nr:hypothetical protein [Syntrophorhabdaceae bacterium]
MGFLMTQAQPSIVARAMSDGDLKDKLSFTDRAERSLSEALLFTLSVVLHLSHSLGGEHGAAR